MQCIPDWSVDKCCGCAQAIYLLTTGAREAAFRNIKTIAECLADELINAAKGSSNRCARRTAICPLIAKPRSLLEVEIALLCFVCFRSLMLSANLLARRSNAAVLMSSCPLSAFSICCLLPDG